MTPSESHPQDIAFAALSTLRSMDRSTAISSALAFIEASGAGSPDVPLMLERVRDDAQFWAECASPVELEAYLVAALMALDTSPVTIKQTKRLAALAFDRMDADTRAKFLEWAGKQHG